MISAFGVEHGEVSKAFGSRFKIPKLGQQPKRPGQGQMSGAYKAGQRTRRGVNSAGSGIKRGVSTLGQKTGQATTTAGIGTAATGAAMQRNPGKTGAAILGGGGLTLTGGVYANRKQKKPGQPNA